MSTINPFEAPDDSDDDERGLGNRTLGELSAGDVLTLVWPSQPFGQVAVFDQQQRPIFLLKRLPAWRAVAAYAMTTVGMASPVLGLIALQIVPLYWIVTLIAATVAVQGYFYSRSRKVIREITRSDGTPIMSLECSVRFIGRRSVLIEFPDGQETHYWREVSSGNPSKWLGGVGDQRPDLVVLPNAGDSAGIYEMNDQANRDHCLAEISTDVKQRTMTITLVDPTIEQARLVSVLFAGIPLSNLFWDV